MSAVVCLFFFNLFEKYVVGNLLGYIQSFSLGIHRNVVGQIVASCPGSLITKTTDQIVLQILLCFIGIIACVLLFFLNI